MATDAEIIDVLIRLRGGAQAAGDARAVAQAFDQITGSSQRVVQQQGAVEEQTRRTGNILSGTLGIAIRYAAAYKAIGVAMDALSSGFRFDATMQNNTVAFTHFLGSTAAARQELQTLYQIAATTPFQFADVTTATRRFLAFGFSVEQANAELRLIGDAIAGAGGGADEINRMVLVLGQINAAGALHGQDLLQLEQFGVVTRVQIAQQLGLSVAKFNQEMQKSQITSSMAIDAINAVIQQQFAGSAEAQSRTVTGQLSTIKDYSAQAMGALVAPLFSLAQSSVLPFISGHLQSAAHWLSDPTQGGAGGAREIASALIQVARILGPLTAAYLAYRAALLGVAAAERAVALGAGLMGLAQTLAAVVTLVPAITSMADAMYLASAAAEALGLSMAGVYTLGIATIIAGLVYLYLRFRWFRDAVNFIGRQIYLDFVAPWVGLYNAIVGPFKAAINYVIRAWNGLHFHVPGIHVPGLPSFGGVDIRAGHIRLLADGGQVPVGGAAIVGEAGPELLRNQGGQAVVTPLGGQTPVARTLQPLVLQVDGRTFAEAMVDIGRTANARGG